MPWVIIEPRVAAHREICKNTLAKRYQTVVRCVASECLCEALSGSVRRFLELGDEGYLIPQNKGGIA